MAKNVKHIPYRETVSLCTGYNRNSLLDSYSRSLENGKIKLFYEIRANI